MFASRSFIRLAGIIFLPLCVSGQTRTGQSTAFQNHEKWEVPGTVLTPGSYIISVKDSLADRQILTITDAAGKVKATFIATAPTQMQPGAAPGSFSFWPGTPGKPRVVRAWLPPGESVARQFTYPKDKAVEIAQSAHQSVAAIDPASDTNLHHGGNSEEDREIVQLWLLTPTEVSPGKPGISAKKLEASDLKATPADATEARTAQSDNPPATSAESNETPADTAPSIVAQNAPGTSRPRHARLPSTASDTPAAFAIGLALLSAGALLASVTRKPA